MHVGCHEDIFFFLNDSCTLLVVRFTLSSEKLATSALQLLPWVVLKYRSNTVHRCPSMPDGQWFFPRKDHSRVDFSFGCVWWNSRWKAWRTLITIHFCKTLEEWFSTGVPRNPRDPPRPYRVLWHVVSLNMHWVYFGPVVPPGILETSKDSMAQKRSRTTALE